VEGEEGGVPVEASVGVLEETETDWDEGCTCEDDDDGG